MKNDCKIRTCVCCRVRLAQTKLLRFCAQDGIIVRFQGVGRSFYLCRACLEHKQVIKQILKVKHAPKNKDYVRAWLQEVQL